MTFGHDYSDGQVTAYQVAPLTVDLVAAWCGGTADLDTAGNRRVQVPGGGVAGYGWWVVEHAAEPAAFTVVGPVEFNRTYRET